MTPKHADQKSDVVLTRIGHRFAVFERQQIREFVRMRVESIRAGEQQPGSLSATAPTPVVSERLMGRFDRGVHLRHTTTLENRDRLARGGIVNWKAVGLVV